MQYKILPRKTHLEIRFNGDDTQCQFHHFYTNEHLTIYNIPKCASTTLKSYFKFLSHNLHQGHSKLLFLREPYARIKSAFKMKCGNEKGTNSFTKVIQRYQDYLQGESVPYEKYNDMMHFIPQHSYVEAFGDKFDFIASVENLQQSITQLNTNWNIKDYKLNYENQNSFDDAEEEQFNREYEKILLDNQIFYKKFLEEDIKLYETYIRN